jgi:hypothetical protein
MLRPHQAFIQPRSPLKEEPSTKDQGARAGAGPPSTRMLHLSHTPYLGVFPLASFMQVPNTYLPLRSHRMLLFM